MTTIYKFNSLVFLTAIALLNALTLICITSQYANAQVVVIAPVSNSSGLADTARYHLSISCIEKKVDHLKVSLNGFGGDTTSITNQWVQTYDFSTNIDCDENVTKSLLQSSNPMYIHQKDSLLVTKKDAFHVLVTLVHQPMNYSMVCPLDGTFTWGTETYSNAPKACTTCSPTTVYYVLGTIGGYIGASVNSITSVQFPASDKPTQYELNQNYPNPFNPTTTISFSLPSKSFVSIKIFDLIGKDVAIIVSEELSAGDHSCQWNAEGLPSGVYFCRLYAGSFSETKKLVLLR
jgi:hypothetical protein